MADFEEKYEHLRDAGKISVRIIDVDNGLKQLSNVYAVRIHSKKFFALIMNDYLPTLGQIEGEIVFLSAQGEVHYDNIYGFYKHQHNEFTLLIEKRLPVVDNGEGREQ